MSASEIETWEWNAPPVFKWDNNYDNHEQVRPYMQGFRGRLAELEQAGLYPYNASFVGHIPGLSESAHEDTGIYLCQGLHQLDQDAERVAEFLASGGRYVDSMEPGEVLRGTVAHVGYYMGGTGWTVYESVRLMERDGRPYAVLPKGARSRGHIVSGAGRVLIREVSA